MKKIKAKRKGVKITKKEFFKGILLLSSVILAIGTAFSTLGGYFSKDFWGTFWQVEIFFILCLIALLFIWYFLFYKLILVPSGTISDDKTS